MWLHYRKKINKSKKALSPIIAVVLLISLAITLALIITTVSKTTISTLSPGKTNCDIINFKAEIIQDNNGYSLNVVNIGTTQIDGFTIKSTKEGETKVIEEIEQTILPGKTESIPLYEVEQNNQYNIVPKSYAEKPDKKTLIDCSNSQGEKVKT